MNNRIFGITFGTIALVIGVAIFVRMYGSKVPLLNAVN